MKNHKNYVEASGLRATKNTSIQHGSCLDCIFDEGGVCSAAAELKEVCKTEHIIYTKVEMIKKDPPLTKEKTEEIAEKLYNYSVECKHTSSRGKWEDLSDDSKLFWINTVNFVVTMEHGPTDMPAKAGDNND